MNAFLGGSFYPHITLSHSISISHFSLYSYFLPFLRSQKLKCFFFINLLKNPINELIYQTINNDYWNKLYRIFTRCHGANFFWLKQYKLFFVSLKILPSHSKHPRDQLNKADILEALIWVFLGMFCGIMIPKYLPVILKTIRELSSTKVAFRGPPIFLRKSYNRWQIYTWIARNAPNHQIPYSLILGKCTLNLV